MIYEICCLLGAYIVGGIPTGYWFARYFFGINITEHGSKNIGATNVSRVLGSKKYFLLIFALDCAKALGLLTVIQQYGPAFIAGIPVPILSASALIVGNSFSPFLGFRGGKGVATLVGILLALFSSHCLGLFLLSWLVVLALTKRVGIASICATSAVMVGLFLGLVPSGPYHLFLITSISLWMIVRHLSNIYEFLGIASKSS